MILILFQVYAPPRDGHNGHDPICSSFQIKTEDALAFHVKKRLCETTHSTNVLANTDKIRSKYVLSKTIDGLEKSSLVDQTLTTMNVYMMSKGDVGGKDKNFSFRKRILRGKSETELEYESFFRNTVDLEEELKNNKRLATRIYLANLRRTNSAFVLKNDFLCVIDADWNGNLRETQKENFVFVKLVKCKNGEGIKQHLPVCLRCNHTEKANALIGSITHNVNVSQIFKEDNVTDCIHASVAEVLMSKEECVTENSSPTKCKVIVTDDKQHLAFFAGNYCAVQKLPQKNCKYLQCAK